MEFIFHCTVRANEWILIDFLFQNQKMSSFAAISLLFLNPLPSHHPSTPSFGYLIGIFECKLNVNLLTKDISKRINVLFSLSYKHIHISFKFLTKVYVCICKYQYLFMSSIKLLPYCRQVSSFSFLNIDPKI